MNDMNKNRKKFTVAILGLGITGASLINYFKKYENKIICWDDDIKKRNKFNDCTVLIHDLSDTNIWKQIDLLLVSPGISYLYPNIHPAIINAFNYSVRIDNDVGLFFENSKVLKKNNTFICVTGSNGKSTTVSLINHILSNLSLNSEVGGNIGRPISDLLMNKNESIKVIELSSYQIEIANFLSPDIAVLLNFSNDHLERHGGLGGYFSAKAKLFYNTFPKFSIIGVDQPEGRYLANVLENNPNYNTRVIQISAKNFAQKSNWSVSLIDNYLIESKNGVEVFRSNLKNYINLPGDHNLLNACAAYITCKLISDTPLNILKKMKSFKGLPHRSEFVKKINEVTFINDSKATNMISAFQSLRTYEKIRWIAGGQMKYGEKFNLQPYASKIKKIYLIGSSANELSKNIKKNKFSICFDLEKAVKKAFKEADPGDTVLLAPGCASFDQFENFEERGIKFCELVNFL